MGLGLTEVEHLRQPGTLKEVVQEVPRTARGGRSAKHGGDGDACKRGKAVAALQGHQRLVPILRAGLGMVD